MTSEEYEKVLSEFRKTVTENNSKLYREGKLNDPNFILEKKKNFIEKIIGYFR